MSCFTAPSNILKNFLTRLYDGYSLKIMTPPAPPAPITPPAPPAPITPPAQAVKVKPSCRCLYEFKIFRHF